MKSRNWMNALLEITQEQDVETNREPTPRLRDPALEGILHHDSYSVQAVPGNGDCFFYTIALIVLGKVHHYGLHNPDPVVLKTVNCVRRITATTIYETPDLLDLMRIRSEWGPTRPASRVGPVVRRSWSHKPCEIWENNRNG